MPLEQCRCGTEAARRASDDPLVIHWRERPPTGLTFNARRISGTVRSRTASLLTQLAQGSPAKFRVIEVSIIRSVPLGRHGKPNLTPFLAGLVALADGLLSRRFVSDRFSASLRYPMNDPDASSRCSPDPLKRHPIVDRTIEATIKCGTLMGPNWKNVLYFIPEKRHFRSKNWGSRSALTNLQYIVIPGEGSRFSDWE